MRAGPARAHAYSTVRGCGFIAAREPVVVGEPLFTLYTNAPERFGAARAELAGGWSIRDSPPQVRPLIVDRIV